MQGTIRAGECARAAEGAVGPHSKILEARYSIYTECIVPVREQQLCYAFYLYNTIFEISSCIF